ncbi:MAG TPA: hypothetical protein VEZ20_02440 [Allosphingosinicella sp.]|jgi:hypothetical protein|nr:hypothetical protein [Allosphingosinicella sp.]
MSLEGFKESKRGAKVAPLLANASVLAEMEQLSQGGEPAVLALERRANELPSLSDTEKQHVGRWIRDVLAERGWRPKRRKRIGGSRVFTSGAVYGRSAPERSADTPNAGPAGSIPPAAAGTVARVAHLRALVAQLETPPPTVDEFLAWKRAEAEREL